ncbi:MAG: TAXI family TRAP transporter solute-binding subunit [Acetobacteraceae bacterium]
MTFRPVLTAVAAFVLTAPAHAEDIKLPKTLTVTAYETGSNAFNQAVGIGQMFKNRYGTDLRILPAGNDVARLGPLRSGRAQITSTGIGMYFAQEGVLEFSAREWGPQPIQLLLSSLTCSGQSLGAAKDSGVQTAKDVIGKRAGVIVGSPAATYSMQALLAFGGGNFQNVRTVEFASYGALMKGVVNNEIDLFFASTISGQAKEIESSPRGIVWVPMPTSDTEGWKRMQAIAPYFYPHTATCGAGIGKDEKVETSVYPYPLFMAYGSQPETLVHDLVKALLVHYDDYKNNVVGVDGLEGKRQNLKWILPYHPGSARALKEAGIWTDAAQAHNDQLLRRQKVLIDAWQAYAKSAPSDEKAFRTGWMAARRAALTGAGLEVGFDEK